MELAARAEVKSIQKIIDALNPLIEKIENIPELKIPKEDTAFPSKESNISFGDSTSNAIDTQVKKQREYNDLVAVGYDRIQKMKRISESGTTGQNSVYDLLRLNHEAWDEVKANNFFNTIPEEGLKRYTKILEVVEKIVQEMVQASGLTEDQIVSQLKNIKSAQGGNFKLNGADSGWTHFATYSNGQKDSMQKPNGITYKVYAAFDDIKDLNQNVVSSIMDELTKAGFKGRLKTTSGSTSFRDKLNGLAITDQMVVHGSTKKDQEIAYNTLKNMGLKLSYLGGGIDTPDGSFSQTLASGEINKYVQGLEKEATTARDTAKAEQELANARKESTSTVSQNQKKDAFPNAEEVKQKEKLAEATRKLRQEEQQSSQDSVNSALKDQVSAWKQIQSIREKIAKADNPDVINQLQETKKYYQQQYLDATKILKSNQDLYDAQGQLNSLKQIELETTAKISQYQSKNTESVSKYNQSLKDNATEKLSKYTNSSKYTPEFIERVNSKISEIRQLDITKPEDIARLKIIDSEVQKIVDDSKLLENKLVKQDSKIADIISQMKIFRSQNTNMSLSQKQNLDSVIKYAEELKNAGKVTAQEIEKIKISFSGLKAEVASTGNMGKNFFSQIGSRLTDMNSKFIAQFLSWQDWIRYLQQGINTVRELDTAMTEVHKVSNATETQYASFRDTISSTAKEIATTNKELLNSSADFLRLGYSLDQASNLAENATLFVNVGDGVDITEATEDMITAMKAFDIQAEDSIKIVDDYNQIGNKFALSASDIGEAMKRSASALETGNNNFEQSIGLITAMNEIVQNSENTGNSLKVLSLRLRGAKAELEDMQEDTDGLCDSTSKLREQIKSLTGVDIMLDDNTFKSTTDIIKELGAVWDKLSDSSQAATLELIAGKSRANNVAALLKNYQKIDEVMESLGEAEGSAMRENEAIVDSIDGHIKVLSATAEEFWQKFIDTDFVKNAVSLASDLLGLLTQIIDKFGTLPTIAPAIAAAFSFKNVGIDTLVAY